MARVKDRWFNAKDGRPTGKYGKGRRYQVEYRDPAGKRHAPCFDKKGDADKAAALITADMHRGTYRDPGVGRRTLAQFTRDTYLPGLSVELNSMENIRSYVEGHILTTLGSLRLDEISASRIKQFQAGLPLAKSTSAKVCMRLSSILDAAVDDGLIPSNPCKARSVRSVQVPKRKLVPWLPAQVASIRAGLPARQQAIVDAQYGCGFRRGEALGFAVENYEPLRRVAHVRMQVVIVGGRPVFRPPKGGKERDVPVPERTRLALAEHMRMYPPVVVELPWRTPTGPKRKATLLFTTANGGVIHPNALNKLWKSALEAAGLPVTRENSTHMMRHTYASVMIAGGVDPKKLSSYLGHASAGFTLDVYGHLMPDVEGKAMKAIEAALDSAETVASSDTPIVSSET
jgi:integrase